MLNKRIRLYMNIHQKIARVPILAIICFLISAHVSAQQPAELLLINGKRLEVYRLNDSTYVPLQYNFDKNFFKKERINIKAARKQKTLYTAAFSTPKADSIPVVMKAGSLDREDVFSVTYPNGKEKVYYAYDEPMGNVFQEDEMRGYVYGERDARFALSGKGWFYSGLAVGAISGYVLKTSVVSLAVPPVFALAANIPIIHIKERYIADKSYRYNENYALGFERLARRKNTIQALKGSAIGTVLGIVAYAIINNN